MLVKINYIEEQRKSTLPRAERRCKNQNLCLIFNYALIDLSCVAVNKNGLVGIGDNNVAAGHLDRYVLTFLAKTDVPQPRLSPLTALS